MINRYNATNQKRKSISVITFHMMALPLGIKKGIEVTEPALTTISTELLSLANALYACTVDGIVVIHIRVNSQFEVMKENDICMLDEKSNICKMERPIERRKDGKKHRPFYRITETDRCREINYT